MRGGARWWRGLHAYASIRQRCRRSSSSSRRTRPATGSKFRASSRGELPASGPSGLWLQEDGCCSRASWVAVETSTTGNIALARGWQTFARARGLGRRCTLHFRYDGRLTLYVRVFGEDGHRVGCCPETNDGEEVLGLGDGRDEDEGEPALSSDRVSSSYGGSSSGDSSSSGGYDQPPRLLRRRQRVISSSRLREARGGVWLGSGRR